MSNRLQHQIADGAPVQESLTKHAVGLRIGITDYLSLMQGRVVALLVLSSLAGFAIAYTGGSLPLQSIVLITVGIAAAGAGAELLNKILEVDVDRHMARTHARATVCRRVRVCTGSACGVLLAMAGVGAALLVNDLSALMVALGIGFYVIVYTLLLKRRSRFNIVIGGLAGSFCVWAGVAAASDAISVRGLILGLLVLVWIPGHIWSLALRCRADYQEAGVPMLTAVTTPKTGARVIALVNVTLAIVSLALVPFLGDAYAVIVSLPLAITLYLSVKTMWRSEAAWALFKFSSVYLASVFLGVIVARL